MIRCSNRAFLFWTVFLFLAFFSASSLKAEASIGKYNLELVHVYSSQPHEFLLVVANTAFNSVDSLKKYLDNQSSVKELVWSPGCMRMGGEPLSSESELKEFETFLKEKGIEFTILPSG